jgi:hypothetical protein
MGSPDALNATATPPHFRIGCRFVMGLRVMLVSAEVAGSEVEELP